MNINTKNVGNVSVIYLSGRLDVHLSAEVENEINRIIQNESDNHLLLNLKDVEYLSSSGLRIFVSTMRILKESQRKLKLSNMNNAVQKIFEVVELMDKGYREKVGASFYFEPDVDKAIADAIAHIDAKRAELKLEPYDPKKYAKSDTYYPTDYTTPDVFDENRYTRSGT